MNDLAKKEYWIWISQIKIGHTKIKRLLESFKDPERIYYAKEKELKKIKGIGKENIKNILNPYIKEKVYKDIEYMKENNIVIISVKDKEYPIKLKNIYDYPFCIYIKGNKNILNDKCISIIGCREYSKYGEKCAKYFSYNLAREGKVIVSGLAKGIDSFSHIGSIYAKGKTIAVVGNGLDTVYPKENTKLAEKIVGTGGAIISEYPIGTKPLKMNFPARNRIISGISNSLIVIEAKKQSGTLITVDFALEQGKDIYVVPGNIDSINSVGTNDLIKQGAILITNYKEVL